MKTILKSISIFLIIGLASCNNFSLQEPKLERVEDVNIKELTKDRIIMDANIIISNPNVVGVDLASAALDVTVDDVVIANIIQTYDTTMPANEEFKMPVNISMDLAKLYKSKPLAALTKGMQLMTDKQIKIRLIGNIKAGKGLAKLTVPIDQLELIKF